MRKKRKEKFTTIKDVSLEAGVSIATVSRVINNGRVRSEKKKKVIVESNGKVGGGRLGRRGGECEDQEEEGDKEEKEEDEEKEDEEDEEHRNQGRTDTRRPVRGRG